MTAQYLPSFFRSKLVAGLGLALLALVSFAFMAAPSSTDTQTIRGRILERSTNEPIPFANVIAEQNGVVKTGCTTNFDGYYVLSGLAPGKYDLKVTYVGYEAIRETIIVEDNSTSSVFNFELEMETATLESVEVTAESSRKRKDVRTFGAVRNESASRRAGRAAREEVREVSIPVPLADRDEVTTDDAHYSKETEEEAVDAPVDATNATNITDSKMALDAYTGPVHTGPVGDATLSVSPAAPVTYNWFTPDGAKVPATTALSTTAYTVVVTDASGSASSTADVAEDAPTSAAAPPLMAKSAISPVKATPISAPSKPRTKKLAERKVDKAAATAAAAPKKPATPAMAKKVDQQPAPPPAPDAKAGTLTAGELHDFSKWKLWEDIADTDLSRWQAYWETTPQNRFSVQLINEQGWPLVDKEVVLYDQNHTLVWSARTDNTGKAELWSGIFGLDEASGHSVEAVVDGETFEIKKPKMFHDGVNTLTIPTTCGAPNALDIMLVVDATGSMGDEINYLKAELEDVVARAQSNDEALEINLGSVFYRDHGDEYLTRESPLSTDISQTVNFIRNQRAGGGGDYPEAVAAALRKAIRDTEWSPEARARVLFLVLDAPPHKNGPLLKDLQKSIAEAARKGIRVVPVTGSGLDKRTEYLMRAMALATNGTYTFLTDDSGVGGSHIAPTTDSFKKEKLNDLLVRLLEQFTETPACDDNDLVSFRGTGNQNVNPAIGQGLEAGSKHLKLYPNPTRGPLTAELKGSYDEVLLTDMTGKVMQRWVAPKEGGKIPMDLSELSTGIYFVLARSGKETVSERIVLSR